MDLADRLEMIAKDGLILSMNGPIEDGDYLELKLIHSFVPVHTIKISSPGGSVIEALKIAGFIEKYFVLVETDWHCSNDDFSKRNCGCVSACALIWLTAPVRNGVMVKIHRPYFIKEDFPALDDADALKKYNDASAQVRSLLERKGYSQEFIAALFRVPREQVKQLNHHEIAKLPIDVALDELLSARCYSEVSQDRLADHAAILDELTQTNATIDKLISDLPDRPGGELERDSFYSQDYIKLQQAWKRRDALWEAVKQSEHLTAGFASCKRKERIQISLRKSGVRLMPDVRGEIEELATLVGRSKKDAALAFIAKTMPDHAWGREAAEELETRAQQIQKAWQNLRSKLPRKYADFLSTGETNVFDAFDE